MQFVVRYIASGASEVTEETIAAASEGEARKQISNGGRVVLEVSPVRTVRQGERFDVAWWCRELKTLLRSGMTVVEAIETLAASSEGTERGSVHGKLLKSLREGRSLSRAMSASSDVFPAVLIASVTSSERTSALAEALEDFLRYDDVVRRLRRQAVSAAIYPAIVAGLGLLITVFLLLFVIPRFSRIYVDMQGDLSAATQLVLMLSHTIERHGAVFIAALVAALVSTIWALRNGSLGLVFRQLAEVVQPLREQMDNFRLAKFYQSLSLMFKGGYTIDEALALTAAMDFGARMSNAIDAARTEIAQGKTASHALASTGLASTVSQRLLVVGERAGNFDTVLQTIADRHAEGFSTFIERATRIVEPLLLLMVALVVGGIVTMMYMPIFDMAGSIGSGR